MLMGVGRAGRVGGAIAPGLPVGRFRVPVPDIPSGTAGRGFACTGLCFRDGTGFLYAADGTGRETQSVVGSNNCALVKMAWIARANTLVYVTSWLLSNMMAGLYEDGSSPTWGAGATAVAPGGYSIQAVSYRSSDDTIHITCQGASAVWKLVIHPDTGARVGQARLGQAPNAFIIDNARGRVMEIGASAYRWRNIENLTSTGLGSTYTHGLTNIDAGDIDMARDILHVPYGANSAEGAIRSYRLANDAASLTVLGTYTDTDALAVEGVRSRPDGLYIMSDEYYHQSGPTNVMIVIRPNPLLALYPS